MLEVGQTMVAHFDRLREEDAARAATIAVPGHNDTQELTQASLARHLEEDGASQQPGSSRSETCTGLTLTR